MIHLEVCEIGLSLKIFLFMMQGACDCEPLGPSVLGN